MGGSHVAGRGGVWAQVRFNSWYWLHCHSSLRISSTKIKNLRWQLSGEITQVTFGTFVTSLVQQLEKKCVHYNCTTKYWLSIRFFTFFLNFVTSDVTDFLNTQIIYVLNCHLRFSIVVLESFKFMKKGLVM